MDVFFQRMNGPIPINNNNGSIKGTNTALKYGGPTEILPALSASKNNGYRVPTRIVIIATSNKTLLSNKAVSRENKSNWPIDFICGARKA